MANRHYTTHSLLTFIQCALNGTLTVKVVGMKVNTMRMASFTFYYTKYTKLELETFSFIHKKVSRCVRVHATLEREGEEDKDKAESSFFSRQSTTLLTLVA